MAKPTTPPRPPLLMNLDDTACLLAVPPDTVRQLHRVGRLPGVKVGRHLRWAPQQVERFIDGLVGELEASNADDHDRPTE